MFDPSVALGERAGLWRPATGRLFRYDSRVLSLGQTAWLRAQNDARPVSLLFAPASEGLETALARVVDEALRLAETPGVLLLTDRTPDRLHAALPPARVVSRLHTELGRRGLRAKVGLVAEVGIWDVHHAALLVTLGADAVAPWLGSLSVGDEEAGYLKSLRRGSSRR